VPGKGIVYVLKSLPSAAILKPRDLSAGVFDTIVSGLRGSHDLHCGPDGRLYVNEPLRNERQILRFNQDGTAQTLVADLFALAVRPAQMDFSPEGDLYFGTDSGTAIVGVWRVAGVLQSDQSFNRPENVLRLPPSLGPDTLAHDSSGITFIRGGPFQGDLLVTHGYEDNATETYRGKVLRVLKPDFKTAMEFIPISTDEETGQSFGPAGIATNSKGEVFVNASENDKVLRYGPDGAPKGVFARLTSPNQIAIGPDDLVYVTNANYEGQRAVRGGLYVFDPEGQLLASTGEQNFSLRGVTVCAPK
jgi:sugar lactone lactonase YvrE